MTDDDERKKKSSKKSKKKDKDEKKSSSSKKKDKDEKRNDKDRKKSSKKESKKESKRESKKDDKKSKKRSSKSKRDKPDASVSTLSLVDPSDSTTTLMTDSESQLTAPPTDSSSSILAAGEEKKKKSKKRTPKKKEEIVLSSDSESDRPKLDDEEGDAEMRALMDSFMADMVEGSDDDSFSSSSSSSSSGLDYREIELEDNALDHVVLAAPDLEAAIIEFQDKTGIEPVVSGHIRGLGIKTARVSFEGSSFLEIIAPDPDNGGPIGTLLRSTGLTGLVPFHWAIRTSNAEAMVPEVTKLGYTPDCIGMTGAKQDGTPKKWEQLYLYGHRLRGMCPFFINWDNSDHPCECMPIVGALVGLTIRAPEDELIHKLIGHTGSTGFQLEEGSPHFELTFDTPEGEVTLKAEKMVGFRFPGFEDECGPIIGDAEEEMPEFVLPEMPEMLDLNTDYEII